MTHRNKHMEKHELKRLIDVAAGRIPADLCIKNCKIIDVFNKEIFFSDIYIADGFIAGFGDKDFPKPLNEYDANGAYLAPGFINGHVHIESSHVIPPEFSRLVVPHGTTTVIADPHEICNVCGTDGLKYMLNMSEGLPLTIYYQVPSCVPATSFENAGAKIGPAEVKSIIQAQNVIGLGELMNSFGVFCGDDEILEKVLVARNAGKIIDGHSPKVAGKQLDAYVVANVRNDHECTTVEEMHDRMRRGIRCILREGSASHDVEKLIKGVTPQNMAYCLFCTDDRQPKSLVEEGDIDNCVRLAIKNGITPIEAICMATINAATCFNLTDRGSIVPGKRADLVLFENINEPVIKTVWTKGNLVVENQKYLFSSDNNSANSSNQTFGQMCVKDFSSRKLALKISGNKARAIKILKNTIVTAEEAVNVDLQNGYWKRNDSDVVKLAVIERHKGTGNIGLGLLAGYGLKNGAIANSVAHDSHNIICAGDNDEDMALAVKTLINIGGGICIVKNGKVLDYICHEIAGLMTNKSGKWVADKLSSMLVLAHSELNIHKDVDPFMTLSFMALPVIPKLKLTDMGLFDAEVFKFVDVSIK